MASPPTVLPMGVVALMFTDIEGSTRLLRALGDHGYAAVLADHDRICRAAFAANQCVEIETRGDGFFAILPDVGRAVAASEAIQSGLAGGPVRVRIGIHAGTPMVGAVGHVGLDIHRAARVSDAAWGGQTVVTASSISELDVRGFTSLGRFPMKDFDDPVELLQVGDRAFPPPRSLPGSNLPQPASSFVGRGTDLAAGAIALASSRVLTIVGPGGVGKTRFAIELARLARDDHPGGVTFVALGAVTDPGRVLPAVAAVLGIGDDAARLEPDLVAALGSIPRLLVLDELDQVLAAAADISRIVRASPNTTVLTTSREPLRIDGERILDLAPLDPSEATLLFQDRARAGGADVDPADTRVRELCRRLDGLPLAIELVAARARTSGLDGLERQLDRRLDLAGGRDADPRQRTLRAAIDWSHDLLDDHERQAFARLAIFSGEWTGDGALSACDVETDVLASLVDRSLVRARTADELPMRYSMLETIRVFAVERWRARPDGSRLTADLDVYLIEGTARHAPELRERDQLQAFDWFDTYLEDCRAAIGRLTAAADPRSVGLVIGLSDYLWRRGRSSESATLTDAVLDNAPDPPDRARLLRLRGGIRLELGDSRSAEADLETARALALDAGLLEVATGATFTLGHARLALGRPEEARAAFGEVAEMAEQAGLPRYEALAHWALGGMACDGGRYEEGIDEYRLALVFHRSVDDRLGVAWLLAGTARALAGTEAPDALESAAPLLDEAFATYVRLGAAPGLVDALIALGALTVRRDPTVAAGSVGRARGLLEGGFQAEPEAIDDVTRVERMALDAGLTPVVVSGVGGSAAADWAREALRPWVGPATDT